MLLLLSSFIFLTSVALLYQKHYRPFLFGLLTPILILFLIGTGLITKPLLSTLQSYPHLQNPNWSDRNAIVVLGIGTVRWGKDHNLSTHALGYPRLFEAARLYHACKKTKSVCELILSGGDPTHHGKSEATVMAKALQSLGIPESDIIMENQSRNTFENAKFTRELIESNEFNHIILVTSGFHLKRALRFFEYQGLSVEPASADYLSPTLSYIPLSLNFTYFDLALHEYLGLLQFWIFNQFGWNA